MPIPAHHLAPLLHGQYYHVINHAIGRDNLFYRPDNQRYFLQKLDAYLGGVIDLYAWCLMPNHFHLLIRVRYPDEANWGSTDDIAASDVIRKQQVQFAEDPDAYLVEQFRRFFIGYAQAINKQENRKGGLFCTPFRRIWVDNSAYFTRLVHYIHANPVRHGFVQDMADWEWSSFRRMISDKPTKLRKQDVLAWFGGRKAYLEFHVYRPTDLNDFDEFEGE